MWLADTLFQSLLWLNYVRIIYSYSNFPSLCEPSFLPPPNSWDVRSRLVSRSLVFFFLGLVPLSPLNGASD
jgi:hypothetical protein